MYNFQLDDLLKNTHLVFRYEISTFVFTQNKPFKSRMLNNEKCQSMTARTNFLVFPRKGVYFVHVNISTC